jgi:hypothetical protein
MPEWCPDHRSGGRSEIAWAHQPGFTSETAAVDGEAEGLRHTHRVGGLGHRGVEQYGVVTELECFRCMRWRAEPGIDDESDIRQPFAQQDHSSRSRPMLLFLLAARYGRATQFAFVSRRNHTSGFGAFEGTPLAESRD